MVMWIGPILRRELIVLARRRAVYSDRYATIGIATLILLGSVVAWDWWGWDRASIAGSSSFARTTFALLLAMQFNQMFGLIVSQVAKSVAGERDRKSLDALLTTRLSAAEIVVGTMNAGLVRWAASLVAVAPVVFLVPRLAGVDPRLIMLAGLAMASTAYVLAAVAVAASVVARTARLANSVALSATIAWIVVPFTYVLLKPRIWPGGPRWLVTVAVELLSSSPLGVVANLSGIIRLGSPVQSIWKMIGYEVLGGTLLIGWTILRFRSLSRSHYDAETRIAGLRILRATRRHHRRPPCGDDPVFWNTIHSNRSAGWFALTIGRLIAACILGFVVLVTYWFAAPAFRELADRGYTSSREAFAIPTGNPFARLLVDKLIVPSGGPRVGEARMEFNLALRQVSAFFAVFFGFTCLAGTVETVLAEHSRETWTVLLTTPLSGREIMRAKLLGNLFRHRGAIAILVGLWTVGLVVGAVHPLGFLAACVTMGAVTLCFSSLGSLLSLRIRDRAPNSNAAVLAPFLLSMCGLAIQMHGPLNLLLAGVSPPWLAFTALFSYEDVDVLIHGGVLPMYAGVGSFQPGLAASWIGIIWLVNTMAYGAGALLFDRATALGFDEAVGRPTRPRSVRRGGDEAREAAQTPG